MFSLQKLQCLSERLASKMEIADSKGSEETKKEKVLGIILLFSCFLSVYIAQAAVLRPNVEVQSKLWQP